MVRVFNVATISNGIIIYSVGASLPSLLIAGTIIFRSLVMDNLKDDMGPRSDPPGTEDFVFWYVDAHFDGVGSMSTMTNPPPSQFPLEKHCVSFSSATNSAAWTTNNDNQNTINNNDAIALLTSADPPINNNATLSPDDEVLLSMVFPQHSLMVTDFQEYATRKSFLPAEHTKQSFTTNKEFSHFFSGESNHLLGLNTIQTTTQARRGYFHFLLLSQISWPYQGCWMLFSCPIFMECKP
jgi:hypothetical protein